MTPELGRRIAFTVGALLVYRLGSHIPLPGVDPVAWEQIFRTRGGAGGGMLSMLSGGGIHRMAIFALGITPYVSAAILLQLTTMVSKVLKGLRERGESGRQTIITYTQYLTVILTAFQAYGIAIGLEGVVGVVADPGWVFRISTVITLTGGTMLLVWLSGQITARGIGNGLALILLLGIVLELPGTIADTLDLGRRGLVSDDRILVSVALAVTSIGLVVFMERAQRRLLIQYPRRQVGMVEGEAHLPVKLNGAGLIPAIIASWFLFLPTTIANFGAGQGWWGTIASQFGPGRPLYMLFHALAIVVCAFLYTAFLLDPEQVAENLKKYGGVIAGIEPGEPTTDYLDAVITHTTVVGGVYLAAVCLIPEILVASASVPFYFGGTSLLIVVCAILDLEAQVRNHARIG